MKPVKLYFFSCMYRERALYIFYLHLSPYYSISKHFHPYFMDVETEAQRWLLACPKAWLSWGLGARPSSARAAALYALGPCRSPFSILTCLCAKRKGIVENVEIIKRLGRQDPCSGLDSFMNSRMTNLFISLDPSFSASTMGVCVCVCVMKQPASVYLSLWFCGFGPWRKRC